MKKFILIGLLSLVSFQIMLNAMEGTTNGSSFESKEISNWDKLPKELKSHILSFIPEPGSYKDWLTSMQVNQEFKDLLNDQLFLNDFAKRLALNNMQRAYSLLSQAVKDKKVALVAALINADERLRVSAGASLAFAPFSSGVHDTLFKAGVGINSTHFGTTGVMEAFFRDDRLKGKWFIAHGADINQINQNGVTISELIKNYWDPIGPDTDEEIETYNFWIDLINKAKSQDELIKKKTV